MKTWLLFVVHNCFAHPLLPFLPRRWGEKLHDATLWDEPLTVKVTVETKQPDCGDDIVAAFQAARARVRYLAEQAREGELRTGELRDLVLREGHA